MILRFFPATLEQVLNGEDVQQQLERYAKVVVDHAQGSPGTSRMEFRTRSGESRRGAFAQAIMSGPGVLAVEFGSQNNQALAPLRSALKSVH